jgi:hypothetical protein
MKKFMNWTPVFQQGLHAQLSVTRGKEMEWSFREPLSNLSYYMCMVAELNAFRSKEVK